MRAKVDKDGYETAFHMAQMVRWRKSVMRMEEKYP